MTYHQDGSTITFRFLGIKNPITFDEWIGCLGLSFLSHSTRSSTHFGSPRPWCRDTLRILHASLHAYCDRWVVLYVVWFPREIVSCVLVSLSLIFLARRPRTRCSGGSPRKQTTPAAAATSTTTTNAFVYPLQRWPLPSPLHFLNLTSWLPSSSPQTIGFPILGSVIDGFRHLKLQLVRSLSVSQREAGFQVAGEEFFALDCR